MLEEIKHYCGVMGYYPRGSDIPSAQAVRLGLYALQHRGQEAAGISVYRDGEIVSHRGLGLVSQVFDSSTLEEKLQGDAAIGHVRYSTHGTSVIRNAQPFSITCRIGHVAIAHNGNLVNALKLKKQLEGMGAIFQSGLDTEVFCHLISRSCEMEFEKALRDALLQVKGAYSLTILKDDVLYAVRDPNGFRPLVIGHRGDSTVVASETCALDLLDAELDREVAPGELVRIDKKGVTYIPLLEPAELTPCVFEQIYFARPDSVVFGKSSQGVRFKLGRQLAQETSDHGNIVVPVPDSGVPAALGYSEESGVRYVMGLTRNHYIGRTFIHPGQNQREMKLKLKLNPIPSLLEGKEVDLLDDSVVRGTTSKQLVKVVRRAGAAKVNMRIAAPQITNPCRYGIDTPDRDQLLAAQMTLEEMRVELGVDSLTFLSLEGLKNVTGGDRCRACFDGRYPIPID